MPHSSVDVKDWDESTYILVSQSFIDGHLPYLELWDNKPVGLNYLLSGLMLLSGKSLFILRCLSFVLLAVSAFYLYKILLLNISEKMSFFGGLLLLIIFTNFKGGGQITSEFLALPFLVSSIYFLLKDRLFIAGILIAYASMIRLNLAYLSVILAFVIILKNIGNSRISIRKVLDFSLGGCLVLILLSSPYIINGHFTDWLRSTFLVALDYSGRIGLVEAFKMQVSNLENLFYFGNNTLWFTVAALFLIIGLTSQIFEHRWSSLVLFICFLTVCFSIIKSGSGFQHYLLQSLPFVAYYLAIGISVLKDFLKRDFKYVFIVFYLYLVLNLGFTYKSYIYQIKKHKSLIWGSTIDAVDFIKKHRDSNDSYYFLSGHLGYWLLDSKPIRPSVTHPSNLIYTMFYPYMPVVADNPLNELKTIFKVKPDWVILDDKPYYLNERLFNLLNEELNNNYLLQKRVNDDLRVWRRIN